MFAARGGFVYFEPPGAAFPAWPAIPTQEEMNTEFSTNFVSSGNATAVASNFGIINSGSVKRRHGVAHPNGNVYILPRNNSQMLIYSTSSNTMTTYSTGLVDYQGGALSGYNGNIYMMPHETSTKQTVLEIDPSVPTHREIAGLTNIPAAGACDYQAALSLGSNVMFFNYSTTANCLIYNPEANTLTVTPVKATTNNEFISGVYHPNGYVYIPPYDGTQMIEYDPVNNTVRRFTPTGVTLSGQDKYQSGCIGADNKIYYTPWARNDILVYDPVANVASQQTWGLSLSAYNFIGGALGSDGNIYCAPAPYGGAGTSVMVICTQPTNPSYNTAVLTNFGITAPALGQWGQVAGDNGKIISADETATSIWVITTTGNADYNAHLSPYLNKGG